MGCSEPCGTSLDISSRAPGVSSAIWEAALDAANLHVCLVMVSRRCQEVSFDEAKLKICLVKPPSLQVSPVEMRRYPWM